MFEYHYFFWYYAILWIIISLVSSIYVHRGIGHGLIKFGPVVEHFSRFWVWVTGLHDRNWQILWATVHRKHHKYADTDLDPHSPHKWGLKILLSYDGGPGKPYHITEQDIKNFASDVSHPDDWIENNIYNKFSGVYVYHALNLILFGGIGFLLGAILFFPLSRIILIHGYVSHKFGIRYEKNLNPNDRSLNLFPIAVIFGGDDLAANHHNNPKLVKLSKRWWEFDLGWAVIKILNFFGMIKILGTTEKI